MTPLYSFLAISLIATSAVAQPSEWPVVVAEGHFVFPLPPSLELAQGTYRSSVEEEREFLNVSRSDFAVMAQPKGFHESETADLQLRPAAIIVRIEQAEPGAYAQLGADLAIPPDEMKQLDADLRSGFVGEGEARGELSNVDWGGTDVVLLEGAQAIRLRYTGDVGGKDHRMVVNIYLVQNNDSMYYITLSYLVAEQKKWMADLTVAMEQMRFSER
jgi:hypothetical protein